MKRTNEFGSSRRFPLDCPTWVSTMYRRSMANAKQREIPFRITPMELHSIYLRCGGKCEVTGGELHIDTDMSRNKSPFKPSLDRIDSNGHYSKQNCRIVCVMANIALGVWGDEVLAIMSKSHAQKLSTQPAL